MLEELLRKHRASAGGKGGIFEEFQPKKPRVISADLDLSLRVVCRWIVLCLLNWTDYSWVRWAGLVPGSSTYITHCKIGLKSHTVRQQKRLNELTQEILLHPPPRPAVSPPDSASSSGAAQDQSRRQNLPQSEGFPWEPQQIIKKRKYSIYFHGDWKVTAPEHHMVLVFHWTAQRKSFQMKPCLWTAACCWCVWIYAFHSVLLR